MSNKVNLPVIQPASALSGLKLPEPPGEIDPKIAKKIHDAVVSDGAFTDGGETLVNAKAIPTLLRTDRPGANLFIANLPDDQTVVYGEKSYVKTPPLNAELSRRIQEPRDAVQLEELKHSEDCLNTMRDAPELEKGRLLLESRNRKEMPKAKRKVRNQSPYCFSGEALGKDAHVHHIERAADQPRKIADPANMVAVTPEVHKKIHETEAHTPDALNKLAEDNG